MRTIHVNEIIRTVKEMCIEANYYLTEDMELALGKAKSKERSELGKRILNQLQENLEIASREMIPICQDTGMAVVFLRLGQEVHLTGGALKTAVDEGVRRGYEEGFLRKSVVRDPVSERTQRTIRLRLSITISWQGSGCALRLRRKGLAAKI